MSTRTRTWSKLIPVDHTQVRLAPTKIRDVREDIEERVDGILAGFVNTGATNGLLLARLLTVGTANSLTPGTGTAGAYDIFSLTTGTTIEFFGKDNAGNVTQFTKAGKLMSLVSGDFRTGDILLSSNTGTPLGWTEITATYDGKFIRIGAGTALDTGGADTHTTPSHTLLTAEMPAHTHPIDESKRGGYAALNEFYTVATGGGSPTTFNSDSTGGDGGHTHGAADNVPAYVQVKMYSKD